MAASAVRISIVAACAWSAACASTIVKPASPERPAVEALLVLPGFGYGPKGEHSLESLASAASGAGIDLFVPTYVSRGGLDESRANLQRFIREHRLDRYERVHVFAFLAGGWTFNGLEDLAGLRVATVVYDRSPFQERAPRVAVERVGFLAWLRYGSTIADIAKTPYRPLAAHGARVGLMVETNPSPFIKRFAKTARQYGPYRFDCDAFAQPYDDCLYLAMDHGEMYVRFAEVWPEVLAFIRTGRFTTAARRAPPPADRQGNSR